MKEFIRRIIASCISSIATQQAQLYCITLIIMHTHNTTSNRKHQVEQSVKMHTEGCTVIASANKVPTHVHVEYYYITDNVSLDILIWLSAPPDSSRLALMCECYRSTAKRRGRQQVNDKHTTHSLMHLIEHTCK